MEEIIILIFLVGITGMITGIIKANRKVQKVEREESIELARKISQNQQRVVKEVFSSFTGIKLRLSPDSEDSEEKYYLFFTCKHPDYDELSKIEGFAVLNFTFQEKPIKNQNKQDATAYLRFRIIKID